MNKLSFDTLQTMIQEAAKTVTPGSYWQHYKGGQYTISKLAIYEESQDVAVVYTPLEHPDVSFVRPLSIWQETVEWEGQMVPRFAPF